MCDAVRVQVVNSLDNLKEHPPAFIFWQSTRHSFILNSHRTSTSYVGQVWHHWKIINGPLLLLDIWAQVAAFETLHDQMHSFGSLHSLIQPRYAGMRHLHDTTRQVHHPATVNANNNNYIRPWQSPVPWSWFLSTLASSALGLSLSTCRRFWWPLSHQSVDARPLVPNTITGHIIQRQLVKHYKGHELQSIGAIS